MSNKYFDLDKNNFHKVSTVGKNFFNAISYAVEQVEYEQSQFYNELSKKLYKDGKIQIEYLTDLLKEKTLELTKSREEIREYEINMINSLFKNNKYVRERKIEDIEESVNYTIRNNNNKLKKLNKRLEITKYVFGNGFEHFMNITKQYGHKIQDIEYIKLYRYDFSLTVDLDVFKAFFEVVV